MEIGNARNDISEAKDIAKSIREWLGYETREPHRIIGEIGSSIKALDKKLQDLSDNFTSQTIKISEKRAPEERQNLLKTLEIVTRQLDEHRRELKEIKDQTTLVQNSSTKAIEILTTQSPSQYECNDKRQWDDIKTDILQEIKNIKYTQTQDTFDNTPSSLTLNLSEHLQPLTERLEAVSSELKTIRELRQKTPPPAISLSTELALAEMAKSTKTIPTYAQKVKEKPVLRPNHTLIVSSTDPNKTGENVIETIREALDIKRTGARVEKIRKARNRKVVLSCGTKEDLDLIRSQVKKNETLKAETPKMSNPLIKIKDVLSYHTDAEIVEQLRAQNKHLFQDLKATENVMRVRYRKRARNTHECHPIIELSPALHRRFLEAEKIYIGLQRRPVEDQSPLVQCTKCLGFGHTKNICQEKENLCSYCGENHPWEKWLG
ncbi:unnamed protein product [Parnassius apollo]|uniref:(apollo) hypothetical protein n=1 Tax=Parnassius apollo TaxID=110799 RepID=A0A8S3WWK7_PARAO|nr:unnamed protein product [Parnassius apollo]